MSDQFDPRAMKLIGAVHDQSATDEDIAELDDWLRDDLNHQKQYLEFCDLQHEIERQIVGVNAIDAPDRECSESSGFGWIATPRSLALAASLLAMLGVGYGFGFLQQRSLLTAERQDWASNIIGIVTAADDAIGYLGHRELDAGVALSAGLVNLTSGHMRLRLESGVELSLAGPAQLDLTNPGNVELLSGTVTADVPESVIGFTVKAPGLNIVDLGTTFGVSLSDDGKPRIHVFDGVVDAEVHGSTQRVRLTNRQTMAFDGTTLVEAGYNDSIFAEPQSSKRSAPQATGDVRFLHTRPKSLVRGTFEHDFVLCFRERDQPTFLSEDLPLSLDMPGHYRVKPKWKNFGEVPSGMLVESYFFHLDVVGPEKRLREGAVTFDRPILGVVFSSRLLAQQTDLLGSPHTNYSTEQTKQKSDPTLENETVTFIGGSSYGSLQLVHSVTHRPNACFGCCR